MIVSYVIYSNDILFTHNNIGDGGRIMQLHKPTAKVIPRGVTFSRLIKPSINLCKQRWTLLSSFIFYSNRALFMRVIVCKSKEKKLLQIMVGWTKQTCSKHGVYFT